MQLPVVVLGEYRYGILRSRYRVQRESWLAETVAGCLVFPLEEETAEHYAEIHDTLRRKGRPIPQNDVWIAALARQHRLRFSAEISISILYRD